MQENPGLATEVAAVCAEREVRDRRLDLPLSSDRPAPFCTYSLSSSNEPRREVHRIRGDGLPGPADLLPLCRMGPRLQDRDASPCVARQMASSASPQNHGLVLPCQGLRRRSKVARTEAPGRTRGARILGTEVDVCQLQNPCSQNGVLVREWSGGSPRSQPSCAWPRVSAPCPDWRNGGSPPLFPQPPPARPLWPILTVVHVASPMMTKSGFASRVISREETPSKHSS